MHLTNLLLNLLLFLSLYVDLQGILSSFLFTWQQSRKTCGSIQISNVPLAVGTPESTQYQYDKAGLRNYIINLSKSSSHKYPRDVQWVIDEMATIRLVPPSATMSNGSKHLSNLLHHSPKLKPTYQKLAWTLMQNSVLRKVQDENTEVNLVAERS